MEKIIDLLEKKVEWIAIGLGALFALFMTYTYVLTPVASVQIKDDTLGPGEVDPYTHTHVGKELELRMAENTKLPTTVPKYVDDFKQAMNWSRASAVAMDGIWPVLKPEINVPTPQTTVDQKGPDGVIVKVDPAAGNKVTALPVPPVPTPAETPRFGRSVILKPGPDGQPPQPPQPGQPVVGGEDLDWVTQMFKINLAQLDAEFKAKKIPAAVYTTAFLQVEMEREELDENGQPVPNTLTPIAPLPITRNNQPLMPMVPEGAGNKGQQMAYLQWAIANTPDILQPLFYTIAKGDPWTKPGVQVALTVFDPATFKGDSSTLSPGERKQLLDYNLEQSRLKAEQKKQNRPTRTAPAGRGNEGGGRPPDIGGPGFAPKKLDHYAPRPGAAPPNPFERGLPGRNLPPDIAGGLGMEGGGFPGSPGGYPGGVTPVTLPQPGVDYPAGEFNPTEWKDKTIEAWAHDETVVHNKTYRYRMRYKIKNPIWAGGQNIANPPELADQFALISEWSSWSTPVTVPPLVNFFVATAKLPQGTTVRFDVFKWDKGEQKTQSFQVGQGDQVGGDKGDVDFSTGWTIVDFRDHPSGDTQIILVNEQGKLITRSQKADSGDALYKGLKDQIAQAKATETAALNGGAVPPGR